MAPRRSLSAAGVGFRRSAMEIKRAQPSGKGPADWFTGTVRVDPL